MNIRIRHARPRDARRLVELAREVGSEPEGWLATDARWQSSGAERAHLRAAVRSRHVAVLVAEGEHGIVGRLSIARRPHAPNSHVAEIGLMVALSERGRGIGTALLAAAEHWARGAGIVKVELHVLPHNAAAIALYERVGYEREGLRRRHFRRGDVYFDAILMAKQLDELARKSV